MNKELHPLWNRCFVGCRKMGLGKLHRGKKVWALKESCAVEEKSERSRSIETHLCHVRGSRKIHVPMRQGLTTASANLVLTVNPFSPWLSQLLLESAMTIKHKLCAFSVFLQIKYDGSYQQNRKVILNIFMVLLLFFNWRVIGLQ